jgi:hypothetical protein
VGIRHSYTATGSNNPNRQVSVDRWNEAHTLDGTPGMLLGADGAEIDPTTVGVGGLNAKSFGMVGDGTTDNLAAWAAITAYFSSLPSTGYWDAFNGTYRPFPKLFIPIGNYYFSAPCELDGGQWDIECEGNCGQGNGGMGVTFTFAAGNDGVVVQSWNTTGVNGSKTTRAQTYNAQGSRIRGLTVRSLGAGSYSSACGFYTRAIAHLEYCHAVGFPSHGFAGIGSLGAGGSSEGQVSGTSYFQCSSSNNGGHGFFFDGADANSCTIVKCDSRSNGQYGFMDSSFLGNYYFGCAASSNGWDGAAASGIPTACTYLGNRYYVKRGQAAGASTNAPSGTTADNTWWGYVSAGGTFSGIVAWVSGTTFQEGGSYSTDDANASSVFSACYAESDQNPAQIIPPSLIIGGQLSISTAGTLACSIRTDTSGSPILGYKHGSADSTIELANSNVSSIIRFARYTNGGATQNIDAKIWTATGQLILDHVGGSKIAFRLAQAEKMSLTTSGLLISALGYGLGFSTGAGTAVTQATSRTTGVIANASCGAITLVSSAGSTSWQSFTVTNSAVAATDTVRVCQKSGTDKYMIHVTKVAAGSFEITFATTGGTTIEQPVFNFSVIKAVAA